jgi:hypothetical protein
LACARSDSSASSSKPGATVGFLEQPPPLDNGTRERPSGVPEQFGLEKLVGEGGAVHAAKSPFAPRAALMDGPGDEFFSCPAFALERTDIGNSWWTCRELNWSGRDFKLRA